MYQKSAKKIHLRTIVASSCVVLLSLSTAGCGTWMDLSQGEHASVYSAENTNSSASVPLNGVTRFAPNSAAAAIATVAAVATPIPSQTPISAPTGSQKSAAKPQTPVALPTLAASSNVASRFATQTEAKPAAAAEDLRLQPITLELVNQLKAQEPSAVQTARKLMAEPGAYRIGAGDVLSVAVWGYPELSMSTMTATTTSSTDSASAGGVGYLVSAGGYIQFPYIGQVYVVGLTETEAYTKLSAALSRVIRNPQITVRVQNYRSQRVYIDGEVKVPGVYSITDLPMTLPEALNRAGGSLPTSDLSRIQLNRKGHLYTLNLSNLVSNGINPASIMLAAGDMLRVPSRDDSKVYVMGEVVKPTALAMQNGRLSLNQALGEAAGVSPVSGNARQIYVVRTRNENQGQPAVYHMDVKAPAALILAEQFALQPGDVVYVDASALATWNRVISLVLPSAGLLRTGQQINNDR
jgi:polysaccharide export outer membrane protein